jgi:FtsP/CotA-like multicopper oxidase with cupredoxin domain
MIKQLVLILFCGCMTIAHTQTKEVWLQSRMDGVFTLINGENVHLWGYGDNTPGANNTFTPLPSPVLHFDLGDTVIIHLKNNSFENHTIHWHGLDVDQENDGVGHTSSNVMQNQEYTYTFVCTHSGTYMYHCHVLTTLHLAMGMYGLFIVNGAEKDYLYETEQTKFTKEYAYLFSEMNTKWNSNPVFPGLYHLYEADYLMINGKTGSQLEEIEQTIIGTINDSLAFRFANIGYGMVEVIFPQELTTVVYGADGRVIPSFIADTLKLFPGERYEVIGYPTTDFNGTIAVNYYDLRNNNKLGENELLITINDISNLDNNSLIMIYPNPFVEYFVLEKKDDSEVELMIFDLSGKLVYSEQIAGKKSIVQPQLTSGLYIVQCDGLKARISVVN